MPDMNGWEVAREIRRLSPGVVFILTTGWGEQIDPDKIRREGVDLLLPKPFQLDRLLEAIAETTRPKEETALASDRGQSDPSPTPSSSIH